MLTKRSLIQRAVGVVGALVFAGAAVVPAAADVAGCPSVGGNWSGTGPFPVVEHAGGSGHTVYRPAALGGLGCGKNPVVLWGNGTFATPRVYAKLLRHLASHGFIVVAANTTQAGSGQAVIAGLDYVTRENSRVGGVFEGKVDLGKVGVTGHSQGGGGAINAGADPRVDTTVPIQPGPQGSIDALHGPMFILGGETDTTVRPPVLVIPRYEDATHIVAVYGELAGAGHFEPVGDGGGFRGPVTAWFRYRLLGDALAGAEFFGDSCGYCADPVWADFRRNAKAEEVR